METGVWLLLFVAFAVQMSVSQSKLSKPVIVLDQPTGVYVVGETVAITCSVTGRYRDKTFHFYRWDQEMPGLHVTTKNNIGTAHVTAETDGEQYSCAYNVSVNGRWIDSPVSEPVMVTVTAKLSKPVIRLDQWTGVYVFGERVTITCTVTADDRDKIFYIYRGDQNLSLSQFTTKYNIRTARVTAGTDGEQYSCAYNVSVNGRWIDSPVSEPVMVTVTEPLRKPLISLDESTCLYVIGETVTMTCTVTGDDRDKTFNFYKDDARKYSRRIATNAGTFRVTGRSSEGRYQCEYVISIRGRHLTSRKSEAVALTTTEPLRKPKLTLDQSTGVYVVGEMITMTCTVTGDVREKTFYFYRFDAQLHSWQIDTHDNTGTFRVNGRSINGRYQCLFGMSIRGRQLTSSKSEAVTVTATDPLKTPVIYLDQTTGVYAAGETINMTCTVTGDNREKMFHFYKGHQQLPFNTTSRTSKTFTFPNSGLSHSGQYRCQYSVTVQSRQFDSKQSQAVTVTIEENNPVALAAGVGSALGLILLLALLGVCLWIKGKKKSNMESRNAVPSGEQNNEHLTYADLILQTNPKGEDCQRDTSHAQSEECTLYAAVKL